MPFLLGDPTQTEPEIHLGDVGTSFISTIYAQDQSVLDISSTTSRKFRFEKPSHEVVEKTASLYTNGTDGKIVYLLEAGLVDEVGTWRYQAILQFPSGTWYSNIVEFTVYDNIAAPPIV